MASPASRRECTVILMAGANPGETGNFTYDNIAALNSNVWFLHRMSSNYGIDTTKIANLKQDIDRISQQSHKQGPIPQAEYQEFRRSIGRQLMASSELIEEAIKSSNLYDNPEVEANKFITMMHAGGSAAGAKQQRSVAVSSAGIELLSTLLSTLNFSGETAGQAKVVTTAKIKTKTRGESMEPSTLPLQVVAPENDADNRAEPTSILPVDPRALKVFRTLFFNPGVTSSPDEVAWQDFVYAMTSTGLFSAEKLYGSAWQFQRPDTENQRRIPFHQPHPRGKGPVYHGQDHGDETY
ncbi:hypothetical protein B0H67DRAFT_640879 [Lasiosphaeris hirsuta]|uniref:Uncharacterized protein n=1 Tax=Lasiosphaeris hirsuta TaxID=260670 RepID=A0AA40AYG3_9PEZI|nr:hypothetical protein B0H67DRAFT_640879 [Lasiosphaeris hirsuta]